MQTTNATHYLDLGAKARHWRSKQRDASMPPDDDADHDCQAYDFSKEWKDDLGQYWLL
jgi:hypothetical protein